MKRQASEDHVHLLVSIPLQVTISQLVQWLKGKSAYKMLQEFPMLKKKSWGQPIWAKGYFYCSGRNVMDEVVMAYVENRTHEGVDDDF